MAPILVAFGPRCPTTDGCSPVSSKGLPRNLRVLKFAQAGGDFLGLSCSAPQFYCFSLWSCRQVRCPDIFSAARNVILAPVRKRLATKKTVHRGPNCNWQQKTGVPPEITNGPNALPVEDPSASEVKSATFDAVQSL